MRQRPQRHHYIFQTTLPVMIPFCWFYAPMLKKKIILFQCFGHCCTLSIFMLILWYPLNTKLTTQQHGVISVSLQAGRPFMEAFPLKVPICIGNMPSIMINCSPGARIANQPLSWSFFGLRTFITRRSTPHRLKHTAVEAASQYSLV